MHIQGYSPYRHCQNEPEIRAALDLNMQIHFSPNEPGAFQPIIDALLTQGDRYLHLADLKSYAEILSATDK